MMDVCENAWNTGMQTRNQENNKISYLENAESYMRMLSPLQETAGDFHP